MRNYKELYDKWNKYTIGNVTFIKESYVAWGLVLFRNV